MDNKSCKDGFSLTLKEDKIYLTRNYWSVAKDWEQSEFCLTTYDETNKVAEICEDEPEEPDPKLKYVFLIICLYFCYSRTCFVPLKVKGPVLF